MGSLDGKVAIVTGGASGIGRATSIKLAAEGASVVVADIDTAGAQETEKLIADIGGVGVAVHADVANEADIEAMVQAAIDNFGALHLLHNNAADISILAQDTDITSISAEAWDRTMQVNLRGPLLGCKHAIPLMLAHGGGAIVNTSSTAGQVGFLSYPAYGSSKAGLDSLTRYVATMYGKQGIRCNAVALSAVDTAGFRQVVPSEIISVWERNHLTTKLGTPEELAEVVAFLLSDASQFITGQIVNVDGGLLAHYPLYASLIPH